MKNSLLALALFALVGTASAHDGPGKSAKGKSAKKECTKGMAGGCCMKGGAKATASAPAKASATKSL
jgi:hypothetical protein